MPQRRAWSPTGSCHGEPRRSQFSEGRDEPPAGVIGAIRSSPEIAVAHGQQRGSGTTHSPRPVMVRSQPAEVDRALSSSFAATSRNLRLVACDSARSIEKASLASTPCRAISNPLACPIRSRLAIAASS